MTHVLRKLIVSLALSVAASTAFAQSWPNGPVRVVVPFPAAGQTDLLGRAYAEALRSVINEAVVVENKTGAGGNVGAASVAAAAGDGQTLLMTTPGILSINRWLYKELGFDPDKDLKPIGVIALVTSAIAVNPKVPANNISELLKYIKEQSSFKIGTPGIGTTGHLLTEVVKTENKLNQAVLVPYRGGAPGLQALMSGEVQMFIDGVPAMVQHHKEGRLKIIAVTSAQRFGLLPDISTVTEQGAPQLTLQAWFGVTAPAKTPDALLEKIHAATQKAVESPKFRERLATLGIDEKLTTPAEMAKLARDESTRWKGVVEQSGAKLD